MYQIENPELNLSGKIYGVSPVQAEGEIKDFLFYFRARGDKWTFSISEHSEIDPVDIQTPEAGKQYGYFAEGMYGTQFEYKASYMDNDIAIGIIQQCSSDYLQWKKNLRKN